MLTRSACRFGLCAGNAWSHASRKSAAQERSDFVLSQDSNHSDRRHRFPSCLEGSDNVVIVNCKSLQGGFNPRSGINAIEQSRVRRSRRAWQAFCELTVSKLPEGFVARDFDCIGYC